MKHRWAILLISLAFLVAVAICIHNTSFVARDGQRYFTINDDALISLRYAWNLAHGQGLVWNPGERVEGFTNPLWTLYATAWALFTSRRFLPLVMQFSGAVFLLAQAVVFMRIVRVMREPRGPASPWRETAAFALPFVYGPLFYWSMEGLEVCLVGFLVALAVLYYLRRRLLAAAVVLGLAFWTRPDTAIPAAVLMWMAGVDVLRGRGLLRPWLKACGLLAGMVAAIFIAREIYYGHAWPNTYVLKMRGFPLMQRITLNGIGYITPFLRENVVPLALALLTLLAGWTQRRALFAALVVPMIAYAVYVGGDALPHWRFVAPYVPFLGLILLDAGGAAQPSNHQAAPPVAQPARYQGVLSLALVTILLISWMVTAVQPVREQISGPPPLVFFMPVHFHTIRIFMRTISLANATAPLRACPPIWLVHPAGAACGVSPAITSIIYLCPLRATSQPILRAMLGVLTARRIMPAQTMLSCRPRFKPVLAITFCCFGRVVPWSGGSSFRRSLCRCRLGLPRMGHKLVAI